MLNNWRFPAASVSSAPRFGCVSLRMNSPHCLILIIPSLSPAVYLQALFHPLRSYRCISCKNRKILWRPCATGDWGTACFGTLPSLRKSQDVSFKRIQSCCRCSFGVLRGVSAALREHSSRAELAVSVTSVLYSARLRGLAEHLTNRNQWGSWSFSLGKERTCCSVSVENEPSRPRNSAVRHLACFLLNGAQDRVGRVCCNVPLGDVVSCGVTGGVKYPAPFLLAA